MRKDISIIITCYNNVKYIRECVLSVINQDYKDKELIIVDDASTDGSQDEIMQLKETYPEIAVLFHKNNEGVEKTRNDGIEKCTCSWILFLDGDDVLEKSSIRNLGIEENTQSDIIIADFVYYDRINEFRHKSNIEEGIYSTNIIANALGTKIDWGIISCIGNKVYQKKFLEDNNLRFEKNFQFNEDGAFAVKALRCAKKIGFKNIIIYRYRCNWLGSMNSYRKNAFWSVDKVNDLLEEYINENQCGEDQKLFICEKRRINLVHAINNEVRYGGKENFLSQIDTLQNSQKLLEKINYRVDVMSDNWMYINSINKDNRNNLVRLARQSSINQLNQQWLNKLIIGEQISNSFNTNNKVAIYGAGNIGKLLAKQLQSEGVIITNFIDRKIKGLVHDIPCIQVNNIGESDLIINTVLAWNEDVIRDIKKNTDCDVISIWKLMG